MAEEAFKMRKKPRKRWCDIWTIREANVEVGTGLRSLFVRRKKNKIEKYICQIYGQLKLKCIDKPRSATFCKIYKLNDKEKTIKITGRNFEGSVLPPNKAELKQHILRSIYLTNILRKVHSKQINNLSLEKL